MKILSSLVFWMFFIAFLDGLSTIVILSYGIGFEINNVLRKYIAVSPCFAFLYLPLFCLAVLLYPKKVKNSLCVYKIFLNGGNTINNILLGLFAYPFITKLFPKYYIWPLISLIMALTFYFIKNHKAIRFKEVFLILFHFFIIVKQISILLDNIIIFAYPHISL
ncbi:MAG: DUF5658 family protein [Candidatus Hydrogenedentota bacterium]